MIAILILWNPEQKSGFIWLQSATLCFQLEDLFEPPILIWARLNFVYAQYYYSGIFSFCPISLIPFSAATLVTSFVFVVVVITFVLQKVCVCECVYIQLLHATKRHDGCSSSRFITLLLAFDMDEYMKNPKIRPNRAPATWASTQMRGFVFWLMTMWNVVKQMSLRNKIINAMMRKYRWASEGKFCNKKKNRKK